MVMAKRVRQGNISPTVDLSRDSESDVTVGGYTTSDFLNSLKLACGGAILAYVLIALVHRSNLTGTQGSHISALAGQIRFEYNEARTDAMDHASSCYIPTEWIELPLLRVRQHTHDSKVYDIGLPEGRSLQLPVCACILVQASKQGAVRPYTPVSSSDIVGRFQLLVKTYEGGEVSGAMARMVPGDTLRVKHTPFNVKVAYPFGRKTSVTMIAGGTGVTPMLQALHKLLLTPGDATNITLLNGNHR